MSLFVIDQPTPPKKKETSHPLFSFLVWPVCFFLYLFDL